ncbi:MAG: dienelactone hydrolase family protein [Neomegalonema sp.]|nr:dienelactone hydrolase family protein [Neomegalonema sp.]
MSQKLTGPRLEAKSGTTKSLVVLLHGYGADGNDLFGLAEPLAGIMPDTSFVSPHAPQPCANNPMGYQWFPIPWLDGSSEEARDAGFAASTALLNDFLDEEMARYGLVEMQVALVGFSQGTMMSLHIGLRRAMTLAGIVGFSGRLLVPETLESEIVTRPPVLLVHGDQDEMVPVSAMQETETALRAVDVPLHTHVSQGIGHGIAPDGLQLAAGFLHQMLGYQEG